LCFCNLFKNQFYGKNVGFNFLLPISFFSLISVKQRKRSVLLKAGSSISIKASVGFFFDKYAQSQGIVPNADQAASIPHDEVSAETAVKTYPLEERKEAIQNSGGKKNWKLKSWMEKYNLIKSYNNVQAPSYLGVTELEILLKDTLRSRVVIYLF